MVRVTGHQPNYLPYLGFFEKIARSDVFVLVDTTQFVKRGPFGWIHRNRIRTTDPGGWAWLTVPVITHGRFTQAIRDVEIDNRLPWARKHWKSLQWHYGRSPHFARYREFFQDLYSRKWDRLCELNTAAIRGCLEFLNLRPRFEIASALGVAGEATDLVVDLCRKSGGDVYLSGRHGRDYLEPGKFAAAGIGLEFQEYAHPVYRQAHEGPFVPDLSIVDLLFNHGPESLRILAGPGGAP
ncbi:MAG: WbqC family protein [Planctomycetes bacterium]|nr:WbqC family protein [Planctomycetota bacterium]